MPARQSSLIRSGDVSLHHLLVLAIGLALAIAAIPPAAHAADLTATSAQGLPYATGGAGEEEREALQGMQRDYSVKLTFADKASGVYLADVGVQVTGKKGDTVFEVPDAGPTPLVKLPPGQYKLSATHEGNTKTARLTVPARGNASQTLYW